jgi:hypothetical protein
MRPLLALVLATACGRAGHRAPPPPAAPDIATVTDLGDRACACNADRACVEPIRAEWDAAKQALLARSATFAAPDKLTFDEALKRLRLCGDAAGVTFWLQL